IRPYGRALTVQTRAQLRRHTGVFTLERQNGNRIQNDAHRFPHTRRETRIPRKSVLDFHLGNHRNAQLRRRLLTNTGHHALFSASEVAQYISVQKNLHEKASSRGPTIHRGTTRTEAYPEPPATPELAMASRDCPVPPYRAIPAPPCGSNRYVSRLVFWRFGPIPAPFYHRGRD